MVCCDNSDTARNRSDYPICWLKCIFHEGHSYGCTPADDIPENYTLLDYDARLPGNFNNFPRYSIDSAQFNEASE